MKLTILTQYFPPEVGAPQNRLSGLASRFARRGHQVTVLTAMPSYPLGKTYSGYGGWLRREERDGVAIIRTWSYPTKRLGIRRLLSYGSFVCSSLVFGSMLLRSSDYLLVESPPLFLGIAGYLLSRLKRARLIFNVSDLWPESAVSLGIVRRGSLAWRLSSSLEAFQYRKADLITVQSHGILQDIHRRFPARPVWHLSNGVDVRRYGPRADGRNRRRKYLCHAQQTLVMYAGLHGVAQGLDQIIGAARLLKDDSGFSFVLIGDGPEKAALQKEAEEALLTNVKFLPPCRAEEMPAVLGSADVILVPLKTDIPGAVPSKLYEAMASEKPVVFVGCGEAAHIVKTHRAGFAVAPGDIPGIATALRYLRANPQFAASCGRSGRVAAEIHFDSERIVEEFVDLLSERMAAEGARSPEGGGQGDAPEAVDVALSPAASRTESYR